MIYANFVPLVLSIGLVVYVYAIHPQGKSNHLFALFMLCTAFHAITLFTTSTVSNQTLALWLGTLRYFIAYTLSDLLFWFFTLELVARARATPRWIKVYTLTIVILSVGTAVISELDFTGTTALFYGQMDPDRSICISVMAGLDTDCNGATVGSITGAATGRRKFGGKLAAPLNDSIRPHVFGFQNVTMKELADRTLTAFHQVRKAMFAIKK